MTDIRPLFRHYYIGADGTVYSMYSGELNRLKPRVNNFGYARVLLAVKKGKPREYLVHRLVADRFCKKHFGQTQVNHLNGDRLDNRAENLEWCTPQENTDHAIQRGTFHGRPSIYDGVNCLEVCCGDRARAKGYCFKHYRHYRKALRATAHI